MDCVHHWRIEAPSGSEICHATCKLCGEERDFGASKAYNAVEWQHIRQPPEPEPEPVVNTYKCNECGEGYRSFRHRQCIVGRKK